MEETIGWLLPLLIAASLANGIFSGADQHQARTICLSTMGVLLAVGFVLLFANSTWLLPRPVMHWHGPTIFELDSFHQVSFRLRLTPLQMPLLWVVWWWMLGDSIESISVRDRSLRQATISCLLLMVLADDLWLWIGALVAFSLFQQSLVKQETTKGFRWTVLRGCYWLGVLLLLIGVGIMSFDFRLHHFSELSASLEDWSSFSQSKQAELTLATTFSAWSVVLIAAGFPISVLRIDRDDESGLDVLSIAVAGVVCLTFAPLFSMLDVTSAQQSLLFLTVILSAACSWQQPTVRKARRCIGTAILVLGLLGLLTNAPGEWSRGIPIFGVEHLCLALLVWQIGERDSDSRSSNLVSSLLAVLLISGLTLWPEFLKSTPTANSPLTSHPEAISLLAASLSFGLFKLLSSSFRRESPTQVAATDNRSLMVDTSNYFSTHRVHYIVAIALLITVTSRWTSLKAGLSPFAFPSFALLGGGLLGAAAAVLIVRRQNQPNEVHTFSGSFSRLLESQFHLVSIWQGVIQIPGIVLSAILELWEIGRLRAPVRGLRNVESDPHEVPFVWELGLGLASLLVLSCLFFWMGD